MSETDSRSLVEGELSLARHCAAVLAANEAERQLFAASGVPNVVVVGHAVDVQPTPNPHELRRTLLFVGSFGHDSPNEDTVRYLCRDFLPALHASGYPMPLVVAGAHIPDHLKALADGAVTWKSDVDDLTPLYDDARVFVVPSRYSAGIPLKIIEAAARGVPVVCTPLVAGQLGWEPGVELLIAESAEEFVRAVASLWDDRALWLRVRDAALKRVARDYSPAAFGLAVQRALVLGSTGAESPSIQPTL
jgi:glycosyltransferase involved in cell wall biosynthesis